MSVPLSTLPSAGREPMPAASISNHPSAPEGTSSTQVYELSSMERGPVLKSGFAAVIDWRTEDEEILTSEPGRGGLFWKTVACTAPRYQYFSDPQLLSSYLKQPCEQPTAARVVHVFNAAWAAGCFLTGDFGFITSHQEFGNWAAFGARLRTANLTAFAWKKATISHVNYVNTVYQNEISNVRFSVDYLSPHKDEDPREKRRCSTARHSFALELSDDSGIAGISAHTVCANRISVHCTKGRQVESPGTRRINPYEPPNTIIVFEDSGHDETSLILETGRLGVRQGCNMDWVGREVTIRYLELMFHHLAAQWSSLMDLAISHNRRLEDLVYQQPDDDSPSQVLWMASKTWLTLERLLAVQSRVIKEFEDEVNELLEPVPPKYSKSVQESEKGKKIDDGASTSFHADEENNSIKTDDHPQRLSFQETLETLRRCQNLARDDLANPTAHLLDMMYKSVAIRDTRRSLDINASLWRLSWITFIFLPLTFLSGFFGMNVDWFADNPPVQWYFIAAVVLFILFAIMWLSVRVFTRFGPRRRGPSEMV